jgi:hypothetical protein
MKLCVLGRAKRPKRFGCSTPSSAVAGLHRTGCRTPREHGGPVRHQDRVATARRHVGARHRDPSQRPLRDRDRPRHDQPSHGRRLEDVAAWRTTPLEAVYPIVYGGSNLARRVRRVGRHSLAPGGEDPMRLSSAAEQISHRLAQLVVVGPARPGQVVLHGQRAGSTTGPRARKPAAAPGQRLRVSRSFCRDFSTACAHPDPPFTRRCTAHNREVPGSNPGGAMKFRSGMQFLLATGGDAPPSLRREVVDRPTTRWQAHGFPRMGIGVSFRAQVGCANRA